MEFLFRTQIFLWNLFLGHEHFNGIPIQDMTFYWISFLGSKNFNGILIQEFQIKCMSYCSTHIFSQYPNQDIKKSINIWCRTWPKSLQEALVILQLTRKMSILAINAPEEERKDVNFYKYLKLELIPWHGSPYHSSH